MTDPLDDLLNSSSPRVSGSSTVIDREVRALASRVKPSARRRRSGRRAALGIAVLALTGGSAVAAASGIHGPWSWWVDEPDLTWTLTTSDAHTCEIRWNVHEADGTNGDGWVLDRRSPAVQETEEQLAAVDLTAVDSTVERQERRELLALGGETNPPAWDVEAGAFADAVLTQASRGRTGDSGLLSITSEFQCTPLAP